MTLLLLAVTPLALAQTTSKPKKKRATPAASASASASEAPADSAPPPAPEAPASAAPADAKAVVVTAPVSTEAVPNTPPDEKWDISDTREDSNKSYKFIGLRYRGTLIPRFIENLFVNEGGNFYSNSIGIEFDMRKGGSSTIPWIQYTDYNTGDTLFWQKGTADIASNYSVVNSSLKAVYLGVDELWSIPLVENKLDFEYGFGVGIGAIFGNLVNNWVYDSGNGGPLEGSNGHHYTPCPSQNGQTGCQTGDHQNATIAKVGGYVEPNWFNGGSVPVIFPHISVPQFSLRYKPIKQFEARLTLGFSLTGFYFGLSGDYGLEQKPESAHVKAGRGPGRPEAL
jgi:hypothetical protein